MSHAGHIPDQLPHFADPEDIERPEDAFVHLAHSCPYCKTEYEVVNGVLCVGPCCPERENDLRMEHTRAAVWRDHVRQAELAAAAKRLGVTVEFLGGAA